MKESLFSRYISAICIVGMILSLLPSFTVFAEEEPSLEYRFEGRYADRAGYAEGTLTLHQGDDAPKDGYYYFYFSDDEKALDDYEYITREEVKDGDITVKLPCGMAIPTEATYVSVFCGKGEPFGNYLKDAYAKYKLPENKRYTPEKAEFSFASVSDIHMNYDDSGYSASVKWTEALNLFSMKKMDIVVVSGDITNAGEVSCYQRYVNATNASEFPLDRIYEARGNHDSQRNSDFLKYTQGEDDIHPYEKSPYFYVLKKGENGEKDNLFIFLAQELTAVSNTPTENNYYEKQLDWLEALLIKYSGTYTNIFLVEHSLIHNFGPGDRYDGIYVQPMIFSDSYEYNLRFKSIITEYKEIIMMSGHSHLSFYDWENYSDMNGTSCRMIHNSSTSQPRLYIDGAISYNSGGKTNGSYGSEGYLAYVYSDNIIYLGTNISTYKFIPKACFIMESYSEDRSEAKSIEITIMPDKTDYTAGEYFDPTGMEITATMTDDSKKVVDGWTVSRRLSLDNSVEEIEIVYGSCEPVKVKITVSGEGGTKEEKKSGVSISPFMEDGFVTVNNGERSKTYLFIKLSENGNDAIESVLFENKKLSYTIIIDKKEYSAKPVECYGRLALCFDPEEIGFVPVKNKEYSLSLKILDGKTTVLESAEAVFKLMTNYLNGTVSAGDVNADGIIKGNDSTLLLKYLAGWDVKVSSIGADCNGDGKIKGNDATLLLKRLAGWDVMLGKTTK